jgi:hypothetical protein
VMIEQEGPAICELPDCKTLTYVVHKLHRFKHSATATQKRLKWSGFFFCHHGLYRPQEKIEENQILCCWHKGPKGNSFPLLYSYPFHSATQRPAF